jgi:hypothetical protein
VGREDELRDFLHLTLRTSPSDVSFDSMSCRPRQPVPQPSGSVFIEMRHSRRRPWKSDFRITAIESAGLELVASISDALSSLEPPKNPDMEKAKAFLKIFAALKAAHEFQNPCADLPDAREASQKELGRLHNDFRKLNEN